MKTKTIEHLLSELEDRVNHDDKGIEFWYARGLQNLLSYEEWRNFNSVINKAKEACELSNHNISDHFVNVNKMVDISSKTQRTVDNIILTRYACYLIAQNGDLRKEAIAFAQTYFAIQTRRQEIYDSNTILPSSEDERRVMLRGANHRS